MEQNKRSKKTLAEGRKIGSGRQKGLRQMPKPSFTITSLRLNPYEYIGKQLRPYRLAYGYNLREFSQLSGIELTLITHFEKQTGPLKSTNGTGWGETAFKYIKALGVKEITFNF